MGGQPSKAAAGPAPPADFKVTVGRPNMARRLPQTGRYKVYTLPSGVKVHVLGIHPGSTQSAMEAFDLVDTVKPQVLYIDLHKELVQELGVQVQEGKIGSAYKPSDWLPLKRYEGASLMGSVIMRNLLTDNEMTALMGSEMLGPYKAAITAAVGGPGVGGAAGAAGAGGAAGSSSSKPRIISFPFSLDYNDYVTASRPSHLGFQIVGNMGGFSSGLHVLGGNLFRSYDEQMQMQAQAQAQGQGVAAGQQQIAGGAAASASSGSGPAAAAAAAAGKLGPEIQYSLEIPSSTGYWTRVQLKALQEDFRKAIDSSAAVATAESADLEADLAAREAQAKEKGWLELAKEFSQQQAVAQKQAQLVAWTLQQEAARIASEGGAASPSAAATAPSSGPGATASPAGNLVAIVNLGSLSSLDRYWDSPQSPAELYPEHSAVFKAAQYVSSAAILGGGAYAARRWLWRPVYSRARARFPRLAKGTAFLLGTTVTLGVAAGVWGFLHPEMSNYGGEVRYALANPRAASAAEERAAAAAAVAGMARPGAGSSGGGGLRR